MSDKYRILVVEDEQFHIDQLYMPTLVSDKFEVDFAKTESEAKEKIRCKAYHVAFVDIMLRENEYDRGGVEVIKFFHELKEITAIIVVSGTRDIQVALDAYNVGICGFLRKDSMHNPSEDLLASLENALESVKSRQENFYGRFSTLEAFLANPKLMPFWEDSWMTTLGTNHKYLRAAMNNSLSSHLPVLRVKGQRNSLLSGDDKRTGYGYFWSKSDGQAIMMSLAFADSSLPEPNIALASKKVYEREIGNLQVAIFAIESGMARSQFCETVWDEDGFR